MITSEMSELLRKKLTTITRYTDILYKELHLIAKGTIKFYLTEIVKEAKDCLNLMFPSSNNENEENRQKDFR